MAVQYQTQSLEESFKRQDADAFIMVSCTLYVLVKFTQIAMNYKASTIKWTNFINFDFKFYFSQGFQDYLPQLVDQMAAASIAPEVKDQKITYEIIRKEDSEQVLKLLKRTFFKVSPEISNFISIFLLRSFSHSIPHLNKYFVVTKLKFKRWNIRKNLSKYSRQQNKDITNPPPWSLP